MTIVVGGVGELYQGDLDAGRRIADLLAGTLPPHALVEELHFGAVAVSQMLEDVRPDALVLAGAIARGDDPGTVRRRRELALTAPPAGDAQRAIEQAATGYVDLDLVVTVCAALGTLPARTVVFEVEPTPAVGPLEELSEPVADAVEEVAARIRREVELLPLMVLTDELRASVAGRAGRLQPAPAVDALQELLDSLAVLDAEGRWGTVSRSRDRLRRHLAGGGTGEGMDGLDWGLWWAALEELDRLERLHVSRGPA